MQPVAQYNSCTVSSASLDIMEQRSGSEATASLGSSTMTAAARLQAARQRLAARRATTTTSACSTSSRTTTTSADREPRRDPARHGDSTVEPLPGSYHSSAVLHGLPCSLECGAPQEMAIEDSGSWESLMDAKKDKEVSAKEDKEVSVKDHITIGANYFFVISMAPWSSAARPGCIPLERREAVRASMYRAAGASIETLDSAAAQ